MRWWIVKCSHCGENPAPRYQGDSVAQVIKRHGHVHEVLKLPPVDKIEVTAAHDPFDHNDRPTKPKQEAQP